jgi:demethylmenaquinone methyltransferase/2-methoxy-6-polyprenyl-1,4-benzoquinol methylase
MFSDIARSYDFLNHIFSLNFDRVWRRRLVESAGLRPGDNVLDVCAGTGDVAIAFAERTRVAKVIAIDRSGEMLAIGKKKSARKKLDGKIHFVEGDVLDLPFESGRFDAVSAAFGLRNLADYAAGLSEMTRVLVPGGRLVILEFAPPTGELHLKAFTFYLERVIPFVGGVVSGSKDAYGYLASSVRKFLPNERVTDLMREAGLRKVSAKRLAGGIVTLHRGEK